MTRYGPAQIGPNWCRSKQVGSGPVPVQIGRCRSGPVGAVQGRSGPVGAAAGAGAGAAERPQETL